MTNELHVIAAWDKTEGGRHYGSLIGVAESAIDIRKLFKVLSKVGVTFTYTEHGVVIGRIGWVDYTLIHDKITDLDEETGKFFNGISDKMSKSHGRNSSWVVEVQVYAKSDEIFGR